MSDEKKSWEMGQDEAEYWRPRALFNKYLRQRVSDLAFAHPTDKSCESVQLETLEYFEFDIKPLLSRLAGARAGIPTKIETLEALAAAVPEKVKILTPEEAQNAANRSAGEYVVLAFMWEDIYPMGKKAEKHHAAIVLDGVFSPLNGPAMGGGGMLPVQLDQGWATSNARIHFTEWKRVHYFQYGYKIGE